MFSESDVTVLCLVAGILSIILAWVYRNQTLAINIRLRDPSEGDADGNIKDSLISSGESVQSDRNSIEKQVYEISGAISDGANGFLKAEYSYIGVFMAAFSLILIILIGSHNSNWKNGFYTAIAFLIGSSCSMLSGWLGMRIAVIANSRVAVKAYNSS